MPANYDSVAGFYDRLSRLVFGDAIYQSQLFLLRAIPAQANVLIAGGGTGWILEEISRIHPRGLKITYVESSEKMICKSKKRQKGENQVHFIHSPVQEMHPEGAFDVVVTPFLLDNFTDKSLKPVFAKIDQHLKEKGLWLFADFQVQEHKISSRMLLKAMYLFFGIFCRLEAYRLPNSAGLFHKYGYRVVAQEEFYGGFIHSEVWQKTKKPDSAGSDF